MNIAGLPGLTHRLLSRCAAASCVAVDGTPLGRAVVTGTPVRAELRDIARDPEARRRARMALGCDPDRPFVAVVTGSLGARSVNNAVLGLAAARPDIDGTIYHVTGRRDFEEIERERRRLPEGRLDYRVHAFEERMALVYQAADVAICRAGALTLGELAVTGVAALLVPLPTAPRDHQTKNALALVERGAAVLVPDAELSAEGLAESLDGLLGDPARREGMEAAARQLGHPRAADEVAEVVLAYGG